jgi:hypothetical protein
MRRTPRTQRTRPPPTRRPTRTTVGGKKVQQFFSSLPTGTGSTTIVNVDGVTLKGSCDGGNNPHLTVENDSGQGAYLGGYSGSGGIGKPE